MKSLRQILILVFLALPVAQAADVIVVIERVEVLDNNHAEARFYYENNWLKLRETALARGYIHSYELGFLEPNDEADADILLVTRYASREDLNLAEGRFRELIAESGPLALLNYKNPGDFRRSISSEIGESLHVAGATRER